MQLLDDCIISTFRGYTMKKISESQLDQFVSKNVFYNVSQVIDMIANNEQDLLSEYFVKYDSEIDDYEYPLQYFLVSEWLADQLEAKGEKVCSDLYGMTVWGRFTCGQSISMDSVIQDIAQDLYCEA
jgi:hypothetical protein